MAQQAILAAHRRRREASAAEAGLGVGSPSSHFDPDPLTTTLRLELKRNSKKLYQLFNIWDQDNNGKIDEREFRRAVRMLGLKTNERAFTEFCTLCDAHRQGGIGFDQLVALVEATPEPEEDEEKRLAPRNLAFRLLGNLQWFINLLVVQTALYFAFVTLFQTLVSTLRIKEEFLLDRSLSEDFVINVFDPSLNNFMSIRRIADVYEWGNVVLWPGLFGNSGPSCGDVGSGSGVFSSATDRVPGMAPLVGSTEWNETLFKHGCNEYAWPDGEGAFHMREPTEYSVSEIVDRLNEADWTEGLAIWQTRVAPRDAQTECRTTAIGGVCYPEMDEFTYESKSSFGYNWTHPDQPLSNPWRFVSVEESGADPRGASSANWVSLRNYPPGGFIALIIPFVSDTWLPDERGPIENVTDFTDYRAMRNNSRIPRYFCVRLVWNSDFGHQLCDPNDSYNRTTGVVRAAVEEFWNDMKRAHFIDHSTRAMTITLPIHSNNIGARSRMTFFIEFASTGAVLTSYDVLTRVTREDLLSDTARYSTIALYFTIFFCALELVEMKDSGPVSYFSDLWNVMDWLNYVIFFLVWWTLVTYLDQVDDVPCTALCHRTGYQDDWRTMSTIRDGKFYLSLCCCIQLLKIIKFTSALVPKMDLAPAVLKKALADLVFFGIVFLISVFAFSTAMYIQLGPYIDNYATQEAAVISLSRSLFGDFDINEILDNSKGYINTLLFITYLFVAVFIMLSMFFAILGESQANLRDDQRNNPNPEPEYGVFHTGYDWLVDNVVLKTPVVGDRIKEQRQLQRIRDIDKHRKTAPPAVERIEATQLGLVDRMEEMRTTLDHFRQAMDDINHSIAKNRIASVRHENERTHSCEGNGRTRSTDRYEDHGRSRPPPRNRDRDAQAKARDAKRHDGRGGGRPTAKVQLRARGPKLDEDRRQSRSGSLDA